MVYYSSNGDVNRMSFLLLTEIYNWCHFNFKAIEAAV